MSNNESSRRSFPKHSALASGIVMFNPLGDTNHIPETGIASTKFPHEIWVASISQDGIFASTAQSMLEQVEQIIEEVIVYNPDIICLPETYPFGNIQEELNLESKLDVSEYALKQCSRLAKKYNCYIICPVYISKNGKAYNAAVFFDRMGKRLGEYLKTHLTIREIDSGLTPGPLLPSIFQTDFGKVGIQICYDINWNDGWEVLRKQGAEIVFWPSAFSGGKRLNIKASEHKYIVVSSPGKNTLRVCDIDGELITQSGYWEKNFICVPVTLGKVVIATWPHVKRFDQIHQKYGRKVKITTSHDEEWSVIESMSPEILVEDILDEYGIKLYFQDLDDAEEAQMKAR